MQLISGFKENEMRFGSNFKLEIEGEVFNLQSNCESAGGIKVIGCDVCSWRFEAFQYFVRC